MIVNQLNDAWEIISHRAHAFLAMQIIERWKFLQPPPWYHDLLAAVLHHDDVTHEFRCAPLSELGHPQDFTLQQDFDRLALSNLVETALLRSQWTGLLVSKHLVFLNEPRLHQDSEVSLFLSEQLTLQRRISSGLRVQDEEADAAYSLMRFADRMSLILAQRAVPARDRSLEICPVGEEVTYYIRATNDRQVTVEPWPFRISQFSLKLDVRLLNSASYATSEELTTALRTTEASTRAWQVEELT